MSRFVTPDVKVLKISQGDTLTVKRRLNAGEQRAAFARMAQAGVDGALRVNRLQVGISLVIAYLVDWSLTNNGASVVIRDQPIEVVTAALDALDPDSYNEIKDAIEAHDVEVAKERERRKNSPDGANVLPVISPSLDVVTGDTNGSPI
jgi:hypothetical protein